MANVDNAIEKICNSYFKSRNYAENPEIRQLNTIIAKDDERLIELIGINLFDKIAIGLFQRENECEKTAFTVGFKYAMQLLTDCGDSTVKQDKKRDTQRTNGKYLNS